MPRYDIYMHKPQAEGQTSLSPESPSNEIATSPPDGKRGAVLLGYGALVAKQTMSVLIHELKQSGNETLAVELNNAMQLGTRGALILATGGWAAIPMAIEGIATGVTTIIDRHRDNKVRDIQRSERGVRLGYGTGSAYYD